MKIPAAAALAWLLALSTACDRQVPSRPPAVPSEELGAADVPEIDDRTQRLPPTAQQASPQPSDAPRAATAPRPAPPEGAAAAGGDSWPDFDSQPVGDPAVVAGRYRDEDAPDVLYELEADGTWRATWDPKDGKNGYRMQGTFKIEYGLARLLVFQIVRLDLLSGEFKRPKSMPAPQPRSLFRVEPGRLVLMAEMADAPFVTEPFTARRLVRENP